jgi:integrase
MALWAAEQASGTDWPTLLTAIFTVITALVAAGAVIVEGKRVRRQLGIENMWRLADKWDSPEFRARRRLHDLRHTHATLALQAGVHPKVVSERLGHSSVSFTMDVHSHAIPAMQADAVETVAALFRGETNG